MTNELKERGKKGQHIFENVNLSNVFGVRPKKKKKAISKCHLWLIVWSSRLNQGDMLVARKALMGRHFFRAGIRPNPP